MTPASEIGRARLIRTDAARANVALLLTYRPTQMVASVGWAENPFWFEAQSNQWPWKLNLLGPKKSDY
jgi:hypothetical protein